MKIISVLALVPGEGPVLKKTFVTHLVSYHEVGTNNTELEFTFGHKMVIVESDRHFEWRLRLVMDNDQTLKHEFLHEPPVEGKCSECLICYSTSMDNWIHGSARVVTLGFTSRQ